MCFGFFPPHPDLAIFQKLLNFCLLSALWNQSAEMAGQRARETLLSENGNFYSKFLSSDPQKFENVI